MAGKNEKKAVPATGIETPEELQAIMKAQEDIILKQQEEIQTLKFAVEDASVKTRPVSNAPKEFELDGKTYAFPAPAFIVPGMGKFTAEQALERPDVLQALVELIG